MNAAAAQEALEFLIEAIGRDRAEAARLDDGRMAVAATARGSIVMLHPIDSDGTCRTCVRDDGSHEPWPCPTMLVLLVVYGWKHHENGGHDHDHDGQEQETR